MTPLDQLLFNGAGRIGRGAFLGAAVALVAVLALYDGLATPEVRRWTGWLADLLLAAAACAVISKRLHDRGRSGWWSALVLLAFVNVWPRPQGLGWAFALVLAASAVELVGLPGQPRFNRFGPPPGFARARARAAAPAR